MWLRSRVAKNRARIDPDREGVGRVVLGEDGAIVAAGIHELVGRVAAEAVRPLALAVVLRLIAGGAERAVDGIGVGRLRAVVAVTLQNK